MSVYCGLDFSDSFRTVCPCVPAATATRDKEFPIGIKAGSSAVRIYKETKANGEYYRVCYSAGGRRERLTFSSLEEAKTEGRLKANLQSGAPSTGGLPLSNRQDPSAFTPALAVRSSPKQRGSPACGRASGELVVQAELEVVLQLNRHTVHVLS